jgi:hypothetical protein
MKAIQNLPEKGQVKLLLQSIGRIVVLFLLSPLFLLLALLHRILHPKRSGPELQPSRHC